MVPHSHAGRSLVEFLITLLIGLAPVTCGLLVLIVQVDRKQEETIEVTAREAVYAIDRVIEALHDTASRALALADERCDAILSDFHSLAAAEPNIRSLSLKKDDQVYCSTLPGKTEFKMTEGSYVRGRVGIHTNNITTPGSDILLYRLRANRQTVIAAAYLRALQVELLGFQNAVMLTLQFGDQYVWATGNGGYNMAPNRTENALPLTSERYGYTVHAGYPDGNYWQTIRQAMLSALPSLLLVGIMTSAAGYWGLFRRTRTRST